MKTFNSLEEMKPYYNEKRNTYEFDDDVDIKFDLAITANIYGSNIKALDINARNIDAYNIDARYINAWNIKALDINANDIRSWNITADDIRAWNIDANDINAWSINAKDISFYAVCFATKSLVCNSIGSRRNNSKCFCLDSEVIIRGEIK